MQIVTLYASDTVTILCIYRHYFFSTLIGSFLCIYSDASNLNLYVKEVVYKSLFNDFTPIRTNSDRGDFFFRGLLDSLFYLFLDSCQLQYFFNCCR